MPVPSGPCEAWEPIWCCTLPTGGAAVTGTAVQSATEVLWHLSGQRFGLCTETLRPCRRDCSGTAWPYADTWTQWAAGGGPHPALTGDAWLNLTCGTCTGGCSCGPLQEAQLPAPVHSIVRVMLDGAVMVTGSYRVDDNRTLVRTDGGAWPDCQDLSQPDTAPGTWSVTARFGEDVPLLGRQAVGELACEMVRACLGEDCRLPSNVASLARQGVSISFPAEADTVAQLYFGSLFLRTYNPNRLRGRPQVYDVDGPGFRRAGT